ncbi:4'-phosphopantetheinyl transferase superfamily protein [Aquimarina sp. RZ0]|uniref:4'-phosphopantetheinyl transferase family protein n=1 Tax=Aquimarina sp. RZ0 TaxID=2607730 RepID=UPI00165FDD49|nr:4'-phosphopantetheinyl transferase superfamily protein [Aquimarina sp. RZ0]
MKNNLSLFPMDYQKQLHKYRRWQDAQLTLMGRLLVKEGATYFNERVDLKELYFTEYNKPYFENNSIIFNISHSGEFVVVAITNDNCNIGIDIEKYKSINIQDFKGHMTPYEQHKVLNSEKDQIEFFRYWTQKEAVIKAHGNGLTIPLKSFEIRNNKTNLDSSTFFISEIMLKEEYACHVASKKEIYKENITVKKIDINKFTTT